MLTESRGTATFVADDGFELPPLTELLAGSNGRPGSAVAPVAEGDPVRERLAATYFDTADLRLARAGYTLRRRTGGADPGWELDIAAGLLASTRVRHPPGRSPRTVPPRLRQMVWAQTLGSPLRPVAEAATDRTVRRLVDASGGVVAAVVDDRITARRLPPADGPQDASDTLDRREIGVVPGDGDGDVPSAVESRLRGSGLSEAAAASEWVRGLCLPTDGAAPPGKAEGLTVRTPAGDALLAHVREQVSQIRAHDLPVRLDAPDAVHKMRVATRRLRSALTTFRPLVDAETGRGLRGELKWLAGELGAARDAEVMRDRIRTAVETQAGGAGSAAVADAADAELGQAYRAAHDRVLVELDGKRYHDLLLALHELVTAPPLTERASGRAGKVLPRRVARSYREVRSLLARSGETPPGPEREGLLHDARKAAKRARYAGESVSEVFGEDASAFAAAMEEVQEALGEHQDSVLTRERLRELARHTSSTEAAFLYGRLHAQEEARAEGAERDFDAVWKAARRKRLRRWLR